MARSRIADEVQRRENKPERGKGKAFSVQTTRPRCSDKLHSGKSNYNNARIQVSKLMLLWKHTTLAVLTKLPFFQLPRNITDFPYFLWFFFKIFFPSFSVVSRRCVLKNVPKSDYAASMTMKVIVIVINIVVLQLLFAIGVWVL